MQAFTAEAIESDIRIAKDVVDELVHRWLFKLAPGSCLATEFRRAFDLLVQKVVDV